MSGKVENSRKRSWKHVSKITELKTDSSRQSSENK